MAKLDCVLYLTTLPKTKYYAQIKMCVCVSVFYTIRHNSDIVSISTKVAQALLAIIQYVIQVQLFCVPHRSFSLSLFLFHTGAFFAIVVVVGGPSSSTRVVLVVSMGAHVQHQIMLVLRLLMAHGTLELRFNAALEAQMPIEAMQSSV